MMNTSVDKKCQSHNHATAITYSGEYHIQYHIPYTNAQNEGICIPYFRMYNAHF